MKEKNNENTVIINKSRKGSLMFSEKTKEYKPILNISMTTTTKNMNTISKYKTNNTNNNSDNNNNNESVDKKENEKDLFAYDFDKTMLFEHYFPHNNFTKIINQILLIKKKTKRPPLYKTKISRNMITINH